MSQRFMALELSKSKAVVLDTQAEDGTPYSVASSEMNKDDAEGYAHALNKLVEAEGLIDQLRAQVARKKGGRK